MPAIVPALAISFFCATGDLSWRGWRWPTIAVLSMPILLFVPTFVAPLAGLPIVHPRSDRSSAMTAGAATVLLAKSLLFTGLLEEPGWRRWLLPRLQSRLSPLVATLVVWFPWALWHAPLDFTGGLGRSWLNYIQVRAVYFIAVSLLLTWLYNRSGGSLLVVALFHASFNTFPFVLPYSPPLVGLIFVWAGGVVVADRMWRRPHFAPASTLRANGNPG